MVHVESVIWENLGGSSRFREGSFAGTLHEQSDWNEELYWLLDRAVFHLAKRPFEDPLTKDTLAALFDIYSYIHGRLAWHRMPSDQSRIKGMSDVEAGAWAERVQLVFRAAICGDPVNNTDFDYVNPLLKRD